MTFKPDPGRIAAVAIYAIVYLAVVALTLAMPRWDPLTSNAAYAVYYGSLVLWGGLAVASLAYLAVSAVSVETDHDRLAFSTLLLSHTVSWAELAAIESSGTEGSYWTLDRKDGTRLNLRIGLLGNRGMLRSILHGRRSELLGGRAVEGIYRLDGRAFLFGFMAFFFLGLLVAMAFVATSPEFEHDPNRASMLVCFGIAEPVLLLALINGFAYRIVMLPDRIVQVSALGRKSIPFPAIEKIDLSTRPATADQEGNECMIVWGCGKKLYLSAGLHCYTDIRDRILSQTPQAQVCDHRKFSV